MKCPNCGSDIGENAKFCGSCGCRLEEKKKTNAGKIITAILKVIACGLIMVLCQSCVMINYETVQMSQSVPQSILTDPEAIQSYMMSLIRDVTEKTLSHISLIMMIGGFLAILVLCLSMRFRKKKPLEEFKFSFVGPGRALGFIIFGLSLNFFVSGTISLIPFSIETMSEYDSTISLLMSEESLPLRILSTAVITPIVEEMVFRGFGMTRLKAVMGRIPAIIVSALIFGMFHFSFNVGSLISVCYAFLLGLILAYSFDRYDSIIPGICCHMGFNAASFFEGGSDISAILLYCASIIFTGLLIYRLYVRYPNFSDVLYTPDKFEGRTEEEKDLIAKLREFRKAEEAPDADEIERLSKEWDRIHGKKKAEQIPPLKDEEKTDTARNDNDNEKTEDEEDKK